MIGRLAILAVVTADALLIYVVAALLAAGYQPGKDAVNAFTFVIAAYTAFGLPLLVNWLGLTHRRAVWTVGLVSFLVIYGALRIELAGDIALWDFSWARRFAAGDESIQDESGRAAIAALLLTAVWVRASLRSTNEVDLEFIPRHIALPFAIVTGLVVLGAATDQSGEVGRGAGAFYATGVIALACSQLALSGQTFGTGKAGGITGLLLSGTAAVVALSVILFGIVFGFIAPVVGPPLGRGIELVLTIVLTPPAWLLDHFFRWLFGGTDFATRISELTTQSRLTDAERESREVSGRQRVGEFAFRSFALLLVVGVAVLAIVIATSLRRRSRTLGPEAPVSAAVGSMGQDLRGFFGSMFRRGDRSPEAPRTDGISKLYREVLQSSESQGQPRSAAQTPAEFAPVLVEVFHTPVTDDITRAFEQARYAGRPPDPRLLAELESRWKATRP